MPLRRWLSLLALLLLAAAPCAAGEEVSGLLRGDGVSDAEAAVAGAALRTVVWLATAPEGSQPPGDAAEASGVVLGRGEHLLTTWRYLARFATGPRNLWLWARTLDTDWEPVSPVGRTWWADVGVARFLRKRADRPVAELAGASRAGPKGRGVAVLPRIGGRAEVRAAPLIAVESFDPAAEGGRHEARRGGALTSPGRAAYPLRLRYGGALRGRALEGAPVFDESGRCAALVVGVDDAGETAEVLARPAELFGPWAVSVMASAAFDPLDLGVRFAPAPRPPEQPVEIPKDLALVRAESKERGGALVVFVEPEGPSMGILWPGDVVLAIEGREVFGEVYETLGVAAAGLKPGGPTDVVVCRGGKREALQVAARRASTIYRDPLAEFEARGGALTKR